MTGKERLFAALENRDFDRHPIICPTSIANAECMELTKSCFPEAHTSLIPMIELAAAGYELLGFDSVMPYFSIHLESGALGCEIDWGGRYRLPAVVKSPLQSLEDFSLPKNFLAREHFKTLIKAVSVLKKRMNGRAAVIGKVIGPWTLAYHLYGVDKLLLDLVLEPEKVRAFLQEIVTVPIEFAKAQFAAGADLVTWADHVTSDLVSAQLYRDFLLPVHKKAAFALAPYGKTILHICGNIMDRIEFLKQTGFSLLHIDSRNNIREAAAAIKNSMLLTGAINNPRTLLQGSSSDIRNEAEANIRDGIKIIAPECALPCNTKNAHLAVLVNAVHSYKSKTTHT